MNSNCTTGMEKDGEKSVKRKTRKDLRSMLGPTWNSGELQCFYAAYRKYGTDWQKVGAELHESRTKDMLETLYNMNNAYLSLPENFATLHGFIAIVIDRCKILEESDGEEETNGADEGNLPTVLKQDQIPKQISELNPQVCDYLVLSPTAGKIQQPRCDDDETRSYPQVPEIRERNRSITSKGKKGRSKPRYIIKGGPLIDPEKQNNWRKRRSFHLSYPKMMNNPDTNSLRELLQEDDRIAIACEALLDLTNMDTRANK